MAFTRPLLKSLGLTEEQVQAVIEAHLDVVNPLKAERDQFKADADQLAQVTQKRDELQAIVNKGDYEKEHQAFEEYKAQVAREAEQAKVQAAYRKLLTEEKISEKRLDAICKVTDFTGMKLDKDGNLQGADQLRQAIKSDWAEFVTETRERGAVVETPPVTGGKVMTREEIFAKDENGKYKLSTEQRQKAIAENPQAFR